jgi:hypothetical protein
MRHDKPFILLPAHCLPRLHTEALFHSSTWQPNGFQVRDENFQISSKDNNGKIMCAQTTSRADTSWI